MTSTLRDQYAELLCLTRKYLLQEYGLTDRLLAESETYHYFRNYVATKQTVKTLPPPESTAPPAAIKQTIPPQPPHVPTKTHLVSPPAVKTPLSPTQVQKRPPLPLPSPILPAETDTKKLAKETMGFALEVPGPAEALDFDDLKKIIGERLPGLTLLDTIPDDCEAQRLNRKWEQKTEIPQILILSFDEAPKPRAFLNNIAKALTSYGIQAEVARAAKIEQDKAWESFLQSGALKLVIASSYGIDALPDLAKHYREASKQARHFLGEVPLLLLSDVAFYLREPSLKSSLWKAILQMKG